MNSNFLLSLEKELFSGETHKKNHNSNSNSSSCQNTSETNQSLKNDNIYGCQTITLHVNKTKKTGASFPLHALNSKNNMNFSHINNYTQNIVLHSINKLKKENSSNNNENESNNNNSNGIQYITLKSQNRNKEQISKNIKENNNNNPKSVNSIVFDRSNIIRVIVSNEKMMKNFPLEYLNEMMSDICNNLYNNRFSLENIELTQIHTFNNYNAFLEKRMSLFNLILRLCNNSPVSEASLFLTYDIFDRFASVQPLIDDEILLVIITAFAMSIKYSESSLPNLDELCCIGKNKFNKEQINKCELKIMEKLDYNISIPTIYDLFQFVKVYQNISKKDYYLGLFILEMFIIGGGSLKFNSLTIIEAIYSLILETNGKEKRYMHFYKYIHNSNINIIKYNEEINNCLLNVREECSHIRNKDFSYLIKKFSNEKYEKISIDFQLL